MPIIKYKDGKEVGRYADRIEAKQDLKVKGQIINLHLIGKLKLVNGFVLREVKEEPTITYTTTDGPPITIQAPPFHEPAHAVSVWTEPIELPADQSYTPHAQSVIVARIEEMLEEGIDENAPIIPTDFHLTKFEKLLKRGGHTPL